MALKLTRDTRRSLSGGQLGGVRWSGLRNDFARWERKMIAGDCPCPFSKIEFRDGQGNLVTTEPVPLTLEGRPKVHLF